MNWKSEAIEQLTKYDAMVEATKNIPEELQHLKSTVGDLKSRNFSSVPTGKTAGPLDDYIINNIVKRNNLENNYKNAVAWVKSTDRAMSVLAPDEKKILEKMYIRPQKGVIATLCEDLGMEQSTVYRHRDQALYRFTLAMYGTC